MKQYMKVLFFLLVTIFVSIKVHCQTDMPTQTTINNNSSFIAPSGNLSIPNKNNTSEDIFKPKSNFSFENKDNFDNPGDVYEERLKNHNEDQKMLPKFKSDQYLGDFKSNSGFVKIICRDYEYPDGDRVRVYVNDIIIQSDILLEYDYKGFTVDLKRGFNKIDFEALNQGTSGPNTAEFKVYDDKGELVSENQWYLATGVKATMIIVKE